MPDLLPIPAEVMKAIALHIWNVSWQKHGRMTIPKITYHSSESRLEKGLKLAVPVSVLIWVALLIMLL